MFNMQPEKEKGSVIVLVALLMTTLLGFTALVVDIGLIYTKKAQLQNAIDSAALASAQELPNTVSALNVANQYIVLNGFSPSDVNITFSNGDNTVDINGTKKVDFTFAKVLGLDSETVALSASAQRKSIGGAFDYTLFSGSKITNMSTDNTNDITINGTSHTNKDFIINGVNYNFTQACEAVGNVSVSGTNVKVPYRYPNSSYVNMPDYSSQIIQEAQTAGKVYNFSQTFSADVDVSNSIYVKGNVTLNNTKIHGKGAILATGNITINNNVSYYSSSDQVCLYSVGNITINGDPVTIDGIMYAPNGKIDFQGGVTTINGKAIGNNIYFQGDHITIDGANCNVISLPNSRGSKLVK